MIIIQKREINNSTYNTTILKKIHSRTHARPSLLLINPEHFPQDMYDNYPKIAKLHIHTPWTFREICTSREREKEKSSLLFFWTRNKVKENTMPLTFLFFCLFSYFFFLFFSKCKFYCLSCTYMHKHTCEWFLFEVHLEGNLF